MDIIIAVDPSARKLAAVTTGVGPSYRIDVRTMPDEAVARCVAAYRWMHRLVREHGGLHDVYVFIEKPVLGRGGARGTLPLAEIHGAMLAAAHRAGAFEVVPVNNQSWKRKVVHNGNADKPAIAKHVRKTWPRLYAEAGGDQDVCDAACMNRFGEYWIAQKRKAARVAARRDKIGGGLLRRG